MRFNFLSASWLDCISLCETAALHVLFTQVYLGMSDLGQNPVPQDLQFQRAEPIEAGETSVNVQRCVLCKAPITGTYFHAQGQVVCPMCAGRIQSGQQAPPATSLARAALYGAGAALAGCILYAAVAILLNLQIGIIAIAVGFLVGKAIRVGSNGLGGRPQQVLAVLLTYFSITTSHIPVYIYHISKNPQKLAQAKQNSAKQAPAPTDSEARKPVRIGIAGAIVMLLLIFAAAPFFGLTTGISGFISLFIIFIGLQQAWRLTGRSDILVMGPYETTPTQ